MNPAIAPTLWIYQPYVPAYRREFFDALAAQLDGQGIALRVRVPDPPLRGTRDDATDPAAWLDPVPVRRLRLGGEDRYLCAAPPPRRGDAAVVGLQATLPDAWRLLARRDLPVGLWGHVGAFVAPPHRLDVALERWMMRRAARVFAYTDHGACLAATAGARAITTVNNSLDVSYLDRRPAELGAAVRAAVDAGRPVIGFIGALDDTKRLDLLVGLLDLLRLHHPDVLIIIAGDGPRRSLFDVAAARGQAVMLGYGDGPTKAAMASVCDALVVPGRVGLIAVEALAMGRPLITARGSWHGPEIAYLEEGESLVTTTDSPEALMAATMSVVGRPRSSWPHPTLADMVDRFTEGVLSMFREHPT